MGIITRRTKKVISHGTNDAGRRVKRTKTKTTRPNLLVETEVTHGVNAAGKRVKRTVRRYRSADAA